MNDSILAYIWMTLINYPRLSFAAVAKRCRVSIEEVNKAAALMGKHSSNLKRG